MCYSGLLSETSALFLVPLPTELPDFFAVDLLAMDFTDFLEDGFRTTDRLELDLWLLRLAAVVVRAPRDVTTSDWPGKIIARRRPLARIRAAVVV